MPARRTVALAQLPAAFQQVVRLVSTDPAVSRHLAQWQNPRLRQLAGGRTAHLVLELSDSAAAAASRSLIVKIVDTVAGADERLAYDNWANRLPPSIRPRMIAFAKQGELAALCLTRVGSDESATLTERLQRGDTQAVGRVLAGLIPHLANAWYDRSGITGKIRLAERYASRFFPGIGAIAEAESAFRRHAARVLGGMTMPEPGRILFGDEQHVSGRTCIIHGDFNSDNIVMDRSGIHLLDFQSTGFGHACEDLVSLEASIRINWPDEGTPADILEVERQLVLGRSLAAQGTYASALGEVRRAALARFGASDGPANLHYATAAIGLRLMLAKDLPAPARPRIAAAIACALIQLRQARTDQARARGRNSSSRPGTSTTRPHPALQAQRPLSSP